MTACNDSGDDDDFDDDDDEDEEEEEEEEEVHPNCRSLAKGQSNKHILMLAKIWPIWPSIICFSMLT